jgi:hypothetical protein
LQDKLFIGDSECSLLGTSQAAFLTAVGKD